MNTIQKILLLVVIVAAAMVIRSEQLQQQTNLSETIVVDGSEVGEADSLLAEIKMNSYTSLQQENGKKIVFEYPNNAQVNELNGTIEISYSGLNNSLDTEVTDGYAVTIMQVKKQPLDIYMSNVQGAFAIQPTQVNDQAGYTYLTTSSLGDGATEHIVFRLPDDTLLEVAYVVAGSAKVTYRDLVLDIVTSIEIVE